VAFKNVWALKTQIKDKHPPNSKTDIAAILLLMARRK
jgi:hypothetical protein